MCIEHYHRLHIRRSISLTDLWMIKDITRINGKVKLTLALPFPNVPIKNELVRIVQDAVMRLGVEVKVNVSEMSQEERNTFMVIAQKYWKL